MCVKVKFLLSLLVFQLLINTFQPMMMITDAKPARNKRNAIIFNGVQRNPHLQTYLTNSIGYTAIASGKKIENLYSYIKNYIVHLFNGTGSPIIPTAEAVLEHETIDTILRAKPNSENYAFYVGLMNQQNKMVRSGRDISNINTTKTVNSEIYFESGSEIETELKRSVLKSENLTNISNLRKARAIPIIIAGVGKYTGWALAAIISSHAMNAVADEIIDVMIENKYRTNRTIRDTSTINTTTTTEEETKISELQYEIEIALKQYFLNSTNSTNLKDSINSRHVRAIPIIVAGIGKYTGWALGMVGVSATASYIDSKIRANVELETADLKRRSIKCETNNYGCLQNLCWSNCGPRVSFNIYI